MSGVRRFLSRRDKSPSIRHRDHRSQPPPQQAQQTKTSNPPSHFQGIFTAPVHNPPNKLEKDEERKIKGILERLRHHGIDNINESNVEYALHHQPPEGDAEEAFRLLMLLEETYEGIVRPYNPELKTLGAVNRNAVTCYLDALLFAMFARLDMFEAMLYDNFEDAKRKRLAGLLRLWVNLLRTGRLITTDVTEQLQNALRDCGWRDACSGQQQDPSEAFTFITGQLELPMLTLKMDMYHTGKEDPHDDHKFVNERLLEVAILDAPAEGNNVITLEDCLEHYFNNRIEVKRHLENQRRNTLKSAQMVESPLKVEKESGAHVEVVEVPGTPISQSPAVSTPLAETPTQIKSPADLLRPPLGRKRADSIFNQRKIELIGVNPEKVRTNDTDASQDTQGRKLSLRTEVLMPAWQFFKLLPWYTDNMPTSDAQVAAHFSKKRPVLGICLKRYSYTNEGKAQRIDTYVDIPLEIAVPKFVSDENMLEDGPLAGNFRLMLQSVVCHRGVSVHSGHYVCLCRGRAGQTQGQYLVPDERRGSEQSDNMDDPWMRFDDLAKERVSYVDIHQALKDETPYLLFYQVVPIGEDGHEIHGLPSYTEATLQSHTDALPVLEKPDCSEVPEVNGALGRTTSITSGRIASPRISFEGHDWAATSQRTSMDAGARLGGSGTSQMDDRRRRSIAFETSSTSGGSIRTDPNSNSAPPTPSEEKNGSLLSVASRISSRQSRTSKSGAKPGSRPTSSGPTDVSKRLSMNMTRLTQRLSRGEAQDAPVVSTSEAFDAADSAAQKDAEREGPSTASVSVVPLDESREGAGSHKAAPLTTRAKKDKSAVRHEKKRHHKQEERECVIM